MCGIAGWVDWNDSSQDDTSRLKQMTDAIRHRGPDDEGFWEKGPVHLGHRRLSIIDLATGAQPISNEEGSIWTVFNGEIYNFEALRSDLQKKGHLFRTQSDTESIVHLFEEYGSDCVDHLRGQFAFAVWDDNRKQLFVARDRMGQKPLYYHKGPGFFVFASEIKSLLHHPKVPRNLDVEAMSAFLTYGYVPDPLSIYDGIAKLPPAHKATVTNDAVEIARYWRVSFQPDDRWNFSSAVERLDELLTESTRLRMVSDVPLGAFLSGGIDSSLVVAYMSRISDRPIKTFCIGFEEESHDERKFARMVAERFSTEHQELVVKPDAVKILQDLVAAFDEPFADSSALPVYCLSQMTRQHVTVALNGDGGDESFVGYNRYKGMALFERYRRLPGPFRWLSFQVARGLAHSAVGQLEPVRRIRDWRPLETASAGTIYDHSVSSRRGLAGDYLSPQVNERLARLDGERFRVGQALTESDANDVVNQVLYADHQSYLPSDLLVKVDRMTMCHSLEGRSPFLDHKLVEFAAQLPLNVKFPKMQTKHLLKHLLLRDFPKEFVERKKMGFGVPLARWFRHDLRELVSDTLSNSELAADGILSQTGIDNAIDAHQSCETNLASDLWGLLNLEHWYRTIHKGVS